MQDQLINTTVIEKLQNALQKVKDAYIEQKQLNAEMSTKLKEVTFGRDSLLQENRELQKKVDMIANQNNQKDDEINNMIDEIDSLLDDDSIGDNMDNIDSAENTSDNTPSSNQTSTNNQEETKLEMPRFDSNTQETEKPKCDRIGYNQYKSIDEPIDFDNVEDLLSSLNDD